MSRKALAIASICALVLAGCAQRDVPEGTADSPEPSAPQPPTDAPPPSDRPAAVPGEYLVKFRSSDRARIQSAAGEASVQIVKAYRNEPNLFLVRAAEAADGTRAAAALAGRDDVEYVEPNFLIHENAVPNDPSFSSQWGLLSPSAIGGIPEADIDATQAWDITTGSPDVVVAVVDSGVDYTHEDLAANIYSNPLDCNADGVDNDGNGYIDDCHGIDVVDADSDPMDERGHGTHVAGILGAVGNNNIGIAGVAWQVRILPCRFLDESGSGTAAGAIECLDYLATLRQAGVNIVASNNSWGQYYSSRALEDAIRRQQQAGILFVAAAGNDGVDVDQRPEYPCAVDVSIVICVASTSPQGNGSLNWGRHRVLVRAPGTGILSTYPGNSYTMLSGTSMATPHVSGVAALLAAQDPARDWRALRNLVAAGAVPNNSGPFYSHGPRLNAANSLTCSNVIALKRLKPVLIEVMRRPVGAEIDVSVLHVNCASPAGLVAVNVEPEGTVFLLNDDGTGRDEVAGDGIYSGTWTIPAAGDYTLSVQGLEGDQLQVQGLAELKPGFPVQVRLDPDRGSWFGGLGFAITIGNLVGDAKPEIIVPSLLNGPLYGFDHAGKQLTGWPSFESRISGLPSMGELDGDPATRELVADFRLSGLRRLSATGITLPFWPRDGSSWSPALADLDGDGTDEIISRVTYYASSITLFSPTGIPASAGLNGIGPPVVIDLNGDGRLDVVSADTTRIWAVDTDGVLPGFPVARTGSDGPTPRIVAGDIDGDGEPEIILAQVDDSTGGPPRAFAYIYSHRGRLKQRLPLEGAPGISDPILADLDGDGIPELVISGNNSVSAFKGDGTLMPGWPFVLPEGESAVEPLVGGLTGDGRPNVVLQATTATYVTTEGGTSVRVSPLYVIDPDGVVVPGFPKNMTFASEASADYAIADLDLDGRNEFINVSPGGLGYRDALYAWDFSDGPTAPIEWGQYRGGADRKGSYELGKNLADHAYLAAHAQGRGIISAAGINCPDDCIEKYPRGSVVLLTATPTAGAVFEGWSGACAGTAPTCSVTVNRFTTVTAKFSSTVTVLFTGSGAGTVSSTPAGINCTTDCSQTFPGGSGITLTALPAAGSDFYGWSGACSGFATECRIAADGAMLVTANFTTGRRLTVEKIGEGTATVVSSPAGIDCGSTCSGDFALGSQVFLVATPDPGYYVAGWNGPCVSPVSNPTQCRATMDTAKTVSVRLAPLKTITVQLGGNGSGVITSTPAGMTCAAQVCTTLAENGQSFQLTAQPDAESEFTGWGGQCSGYALTCTVSPYNSDATVTATFMLRSSLRLLQVGIGGDPDIGGITSSTGGIKCSDGFKVCSAYLPLDSTVTLTAYWGATGTFGAWSGDCAGTEPTCTLTMDRARNATASFVSTLPPKPLTITIGGDSTMGKVTAPDVGIDCGQGATDCSANVTHNKVVVLTATPASNGRFLGWSGGSCSGTSPTCTVTMSAARNFTARFEAVTHTVQLVIGGDAAKGKVTGSPGGFNCGQGSASCSATLVAGTAVTLTATPASNGVFQGWAGDCAGSATTCSFTVSANNSVTATFATAPPSAMHALQVTVAGGGSGRVTSSVGGISCGLGATACSASLPENSSVVLTAAVNSGSSLGGWSGACSGASATCVVSMTAARNVTATFNAANTQPPGGGGGGGSGGGGGGGGVDTLTLLALLLLSGAIRMRRFRLYRSDS